MCFKLQVINFKNFVLEDAGGQDWRLHMRDLHSHLRNAWSTDDVFLNTCKLIMTPSKVQVTMFQWGKQANVRFHIQNTVLRVHMFLLERKYWQLLRTPQVGSVLIRTVDSAPKCLSNQMVKFIDPISAKMTETSPCFWNDCFHFNLSCLSTSPVICHSSSLQNVWEMSK